VHGMNRKRFLLLVFVIVVFVLVFLFVILPIINLEVVRKQHLEIMKNLNRTETKSELRALFDRDHEILSLCSTMRTFIKRFIIGSMTIGTSNFNNDFLFFCHFLFLDSLFFLS